MISFVQSSNLTYLEEAKAKVDAAAKYGKTDKKSLKAMLKKIDADISQTKRQIQLKDKVYENTLELYDINRCFETMTQEVV